MVDEEPGRREAGGAAGLLEALVDLVLPAECAVCGEPAVRLCRACRLDLEAAVARPRRVEAGALALPLLPGGEPLPVMAAGAYEAPLSTALLAFKDHHGLHLRPLLGDALARTVAALRCEPGIAGVGHALLVPVPGGASGFRRRGYEPVAELARSLPPAWVRADLVRAPGGMGAVLPGGVPGRAPGQGGGDRSGGRSAAGPSHAGTGARERRRRARQWRVRQGAIRPGTPVVLVDDVLTTGATLASLALAVRRAGAVPVAAAVVAGVQPAAVADRAASGGTPR